MARQLDCEIFLALADVDETWNCEEEYDFRRSRWPRYDDEDEDEEDEDESDGPYELTDLIDSDVELRHWVAPAGGSSRAPKGRIGVTVGELCYTTPSQDLEPLATALLQPFSLWELAARSAPRLAALVDTYGLDWCRTLLRGWAAENRGYEPDETRLKWMSGALAPLSRALAARKSPGQTLAAEVLAAQWTSLRKRWAEVLKMEGSEKDRAKALAGLARPALALIESCGHSQQPGLHRELIDALLEKPAEILPLQLGLLRAAHAGYRLEALRTLGLKCIHQGCAAELEARLRAPVRANDDWSITAPLRCSCKLCATLTTFLRAAGAQRLQWPLAQTERAHVHRKIDSYGLPMTHTTRRTGRPFTLMLEKTAALFEREAITRKVAQQDLRWLGAVAGRF